MNDKIAIRFGHAQLKNGLKTSANGIVNEYDTVREFGPYTINELTRAGYDVVNVTPMSTKYSDGEEDLKEGINTAKLLGCKIFVSLHLNCIGTGTANGVETLYDKGAIQGKELSGCIQEQIVKLGFKDRGIEERNNLAELNASFISCIVEGFFIDNAGDVELYKKIGPEKFGQAIAAGIMKYVSPGEKSKEGRLSLMEYNLQPIAKGMLKNTSTLDCCSKPSNSARTGSKLKKGVNEPINIYAKCKNDGIEWYLVNPTTEQWVAAHYVQLI